MRPPLKSIVSWPHAGPPAVSGADAVGAGTASAGEGSAAAAAPGAARQSPAARTRVRAVGRGEGRLAGRIDMTRTVPAGSGPGRRRTGADWSPPPVGVMV